jgi:hypothetical protein
MARKHKRFVYAEMQGLYWLIRWSFNIGFGMSWIVIFGYVIFMQQFEIFVKASISVLAICLTTASLFYSRARALNDGPMKRRTLYSAERATQASVLILIGVVLGVAVYSFSIVAGLEVWPAGTVITNIKDFPGKNINTWIYLYFFPFSFLMLGCISYFLSLRSILRDFVRVVGLKELAARSWDAP